MAMEKTNVDKWIGFNIWRNRLVGVNFMRTYYLPFLACASVSMEPQQFRGKPLTLTSSAALVLPETPLTFQTSRPIEISTPAKVKHSCRS